MPQELGHPLRRDGTSQRQRPLPALLPENNPVDARSVEDGLVYAYRLAEQITYYNPQSQKDGNWQAFFPGEDTEILKALLTERQEQTKRNLPPQQALFITFLYLMELLKKELNGLTQKHLSFYYEEVLGFKRKDPRPDRVHVLFQIAKQKSRECLQMGTALLAGKDEQKKPLIYKLKDEIVINTAKVGIVKSYQGNDLNTSISYSVPSAKPFSPFGTGLEGGSNLLIGIEHIIPDSQLSLLFQIVEGSALNPDGIEDEDIVWSFWSGGWRNINARGERNYAQILRDTTINLQKSGIITFSFIDEIQPGLGNEALGSDMYWLRASITKNPDIAPRMIDVQAQAAIAVFEDRQNDPKHLEQALEAQKIKTLQIRNANIRKVKQPYPSFDGSPKENDRSFFARVSERLRHKNRAITIWDYEHLVLGEFEEIYKAKAISHTGRNRERNYSEFRPGEIEVVIIPKITDLENQNVLQPQASNALIRQVKNYLQQINSPVPILHVSNPVYEKIMVQFKVGFKEGFANGFYRNLLNNSIKRYLSPWAYDEGADIVFGGRIYGSQLLAFIENQAYVDYITDFRLFQQNAGPTIGEMTVNLDFRVRSPYGDEWEVAEAYTAASILISADDHLIDMLAPNEYPCEGSPICEDGIGCMIVSIDFIVGNP